MYYLINVNAIVLFPPYLCRKIQRLFSHLKSYYMYERQINIKYGNKSETILGR